MRPPRARSWASRRLQSGAVMMLPLEMAGFAPRISRYAVRSRSGIGKSAGLPKTSCETSMREKASTEPEEYTFFVPSPRAKGMRCSIEL